MKFKFCDDENLLSEKKNFKKWKKLRKKLKVLRDHKTFIKALGKKCKIRVMPVYENKKAREPF